MPDVQLAKAKLIEMKRDFSDVDKTRPEMVVQFNPESLKVSYAYQAPPDPGAGGTADAGKAGKQMPGKASAKLSVQLWFDVTATATAENREDVRLKTEKVVYFITPVAKPGEDHAAAPALRFEWGTFKFEGTVDSVEESLEFFSPDGRPLRASVSFGMSRGEIANYRAAGGGGPGGGPPSPGTRPLAQATAGGSLQQMVAAAGVGVSGGWQAVAAANGIEDPRNLAPGRFVDLNASVRIGG